MDVIDHTAAVLRAFDIEPKPLDRIIESYNRRHRELSSRARRIVAEAAFGVLRWRRKLDGWLSMQGIARPDNRVRAALFLLWASPDFEHRLDLGGLSRAFGVEPPRESSMPKNFPGGVAAFNSFPDFLYDMMRKGRGANEAAALASSLNSQATPSLRINALKAGRGEAAAGLAAEGVATSPAPLSPYGLLLEKRAHVEGTAAYRRGLVEIQDEASQLSLIAADPRPGETVLDACAGAGGKTIMAAMLMENRGRIVASDIDSAKLKELARRASRAGAACIEAMGSGALCRRTDLKGKADLVIIDAPCSGTGTLRRAPDLKWRISSSDIERMRLLQMELLIKYSDFVRPGGRIAYITCSILDVENERVIEEFAKGKKLEVMNAAASFDRHGVNPERIVTPEGYFKTDPRGGMRDGFFTAVIGGF